MRDCIIECEKQISLHFCIEFEWLSFLTTVKFVLPFVVAFPEFFLQWLGAAVAYALGHTTSHWAV